MSKREEEWRRHGRDLLTLIRAGVDDGLSKWKWRRAVIALGDEVLDAIRDLREVVDELHDRAPAKVEQPAPPAKHAPGEYDMTLRVDAVLVQETIESAATAYWCSAWDVDADGTYWFVEAEDAAVEKTDAAAEPGESMDPEEREAERSRRIVVDHAAMLRGLAIFASDPKHAHHWSDMIRGTGDAYTGDVLVQVLCFGEVRYG